MNHETIKRVIFDQRRVIQRIQIVPRKYVLEPHANYIIVGIRRAGKSTLLYERARDLVAEGVDWDQIIYLNFEDERLLGFTLADFDDVVSTAAALTDGEPYFFFDEIQNIEGWERFARRLADEQRRVYITGSNAEMLSSEMEQRLGGRYLVCELMPYDFDEYLTARTIDHGEEARLTAELVGKIQAAATDYLQNGGLPESVGFIDRRSYAENVYQKVLLGDIAARHSIRNVATLRLLMKKIAETVTSEVTFSSLRKAVASTGASITTDSVINYVGYAEDAYLLFHTGNYVARFGQREGTPRYYFGDNGLLGLFLVDKASLLLENAVALSLRRRFGRELYYLKSQKTGIDVDFYLPDQSLAVQVAYTLDGGSEAREVASLEALARYERLAPRRSVIVTYADDERVIDANGASIEVLPLWKFLLEG
jgi:predicted AAA+ superfamily ATPase